MPLLDLICTKCGNEVIDVWLKANENPGICKLCKGALARIPGGHFKLVYNNKTDMCDWSGNTSMYWNEVKKQRAEGKNVKGANE